MRNSIRQVFDHVIDAGVPALGRGAHRSGDLGHLTVDPIEYAGQVFHDAADQQFLQPFCELVPYKVQSESLLSRGDPRRSGGHGKSAAGEERAEHGDQGGAKQGKASSGHELYHG